MEIKVDEPPFHLEGSGGSQRRITNVAPRIAVDELIDEWEASLRNKAPALPTGIAPLDKALDGGLYDEMYVLGGLPGFGKTALALQIAYQCAKQGRDVYYYSFEIGLGKALARIVSHISASYEPSMHLAVREVETYYKLTGDKASSYNQAMGELRQHAPKLFILDGSEAKEHEYTASEIDRFTHKHITQTGRIPVIVIDKLQRIPHDADIDASETAQVEHAIYRMACIAKYHHCPVIVLSDLTKQGELKGSSNIAHDASVTMFLKLEGLRDNSNESDRAERLNQNPRQVELLIDKNRIYIAGQTVMLDYFAGNHIFKASSWHK